MQNYNDSDLVIEMIFMVNINQFSLDPGGGTVWACGR